MIKHYQTTLYLQQQKAKPTGYPIAHPVHATETGEALFKAPLRGRFIADLKKSVKTPPEHFDALYLALLYHVAEFVQHIPTVEDHSIQWLDAALHRSQQALQNLEDRLQHSHATHKMTSAYKAQLTYAVFSAALLLHIDAIVTQYAAHICNEQGEFIKEWQPLLESLLEAGSFYQTKLPVHHSDEPKLHPITVLLAKNLMPADGLLWLASHPQLFQEWLSALLGEEGTGSIIEAILTVIPLTRPKEHLLLYPYPGFPVAPGPHAPQAPEPMPATPVQPNANTPDELSEQFIDWLRQRIADGSIGFNTIDGGAHMMRQGLLLMHLPEMFKFFCRTQPNSPLWRQAYQKLMVSLGIFTLSDPTMGTFFINGNAFTNGALVKNVDKLFPAGVKPPLSKVATMSEVPQANAYPTLLTSDIHRKRFSSKKSEGG